MYRIAVCDDDAADRGATIGALGGYFEAKSLPCEFTEFCSAEEFLHPSRAYCFDMAFFDVVMGGADGITAAKRLRAEDPLVIIVFLSTYAEFVFNSFSAEPLHYIVKPLSEGPLTALMDRAVAKVDARKKDCFSASFNRNTFCLPLQEIMYFESEKRVICAAAASGKYRFYGRMDDVEKRLSGCGFARCHQSYVVNLRHVRKADEEKVLLCDGTVLAISRSRAAAFKKTFQRYVSSLIH